PDPPLRRFVHRTSRSVIEGDANAAHVRRMRASSQAVNQENPSERGAVPYMKNTTRCSNGQPGLTNHSAEDSVISILSIRFYRTSPRFCCNGSTEAAIARCC